MAISLTAAAADHVKRFLASREQAAGLRLGVKPTGCSGLSYVVDVADEIGQDDVVFECGDVKVIVGRKDMLYLDGTEIDYGRDGLNAGLRFRNPNEKATCGCGESFTV